VLGLQDSVFDRRAPERGADGQEGMGPDAGVLKNVPMVQQPGEWVCKEHKNIFDRQCRVRAVAALGLSLEA
jgi:hypothetical protein